MSEPQVDVVIVSYNTRTLTLAAVASAEASAGVRTRVFVVDNASSDGSADAVRQAHPGTVVTVLDENVGFGRGNNVALDMTDAPYVLLLNSDATFAEADGLRSLVAYLDRHPDVGVVGPRLVGPDDALQFSARSFPGLVPELARPTGFHRLLPEAVRSRKLASEFRDHSVAGPTDWLTGACLLVRREVLDVVGGFDPAIFLYGEELDWCWRVREAGWELSLEPDVVVVHHRGASAEESGGWKLRMAMAGDAYTVRKHRGWVYLAVFAVARAAGLGLEAVLQGLYGRISGNGLRVRRGGYARLALGAWIAALTGGGASRPGSPAFRPSESGE